MPRDHRKFDAFKLADQLGLAVYRTTSEFPASERYGLQSQMRRAAVGALANLRRSYGRR